MKRKSVLRFAWEIIRFIIFKMPRYRSAQIAFSGVAILFVSVVLITHYSMLKNILIAPTLIGVGLILLGILYMGVEFAPEEEETEILIFKTVMKELKDIKNRLEKLEKYHEQDKIKVR